MSSQPNAHGKSWWDVLALIAGIDATPTQKYLLTLILQHTHRTKHFAWASQETLAKEMCVDLSTVVRTFRWAKQIGVVGVNRVRTGKGKDDQYNQFWLIIERLEELQRPSKHQAPMPGAQDKHPAPMPGAEREQQAPAPPSTRHLTPEHQAFDREAPGTHALVVFEVKQYSEEKQLVNKAVVDSLARVGHPQDHAVAQPDDDHTHSLSKFKIQEQLRNRQILTNKLFDKHPELRTLPNIEACLNRAYDVIENRRLAKGTVPANPESYYLSAVERYFAEGEAVPRRNYIESFAERRSRRNAEALTRVLGKGRKSDE